MVLQVQQVTSTITLHARGLAISDAVVQPADGGELRAQVDTQPERQTATLNLPAPLPPGTVKARLRFSGQLSPSMHGLYLGSDGVHRAICTQCEATDARAIFPCFDEPEYKAKLQWTLRTGPGVIALANGPLQQREGGATAQVFHFEPTHPVSSYLAAVVVGDLESCPEERVNGIPLRVYVPRGKVAQTGFAQEFTKKLLPFYEEYFDYPYPFAKYDQVAVPGFDAGAMENIEHLVGRPGFSYRIGSALDAPLDDVRPSSPEIVATAWFMPHELPELQPETATALVALSRSGRIDLTGSGLTPSSARPTR